MKTRIYQGRDLIGRFTCDGRKPVKISKLDRLNHRLIRYTKRLTLASIALWTLTGALFIGMAQADTVEVEKEVIKEVRSVPPILKKIMTCESGYKHYDKSGQVLTRGNTNKTVDTGIGQINTVWHKTASDMKLDLTKEADNITFSIWLFDNYGSEPWYSSRACWSK